MGRRSPRQISKLAREGEKHAARCSKPSEADLELKAGSVPAVAAILALIFAPSEAAPVAYVAGVAGPLIGADLLHLEEIEQSAVGVASIGGAGTFDGIVLSGIVAAYLA